MVTPQPEDGPCAQCKPQSTSGRKNFGPEARLSPTRRLSLSYWPPLGDIRRACSCQPPPCKPSEWACRIQAGSIKEHVSRLVRREIKNCSFIWEGKQLRLEVSNWLRQPDPTMVCEAFRQASFKNFFDQLRVWSGVIEVGAFPKSMELRIKGSAELTLLSCELWHYMGLGIRCEKGAVEGGAQQSLTVNREVADFFKRELSWGQAHLRPWNVLRALNRCCAYVGQPSRSRW